MITKYIKKIILTLFILGLFPIGYAFAQLNAGTISISTIPQVPGANQEIKVNIESFSFDLRRANIKWFLDNKSYKEGVGEDSITFTTNDIGEKTVVDVTIITTTGLSMQKQLVVDPSEIDLLWEASDSYSPPFYRGKTLPSAESMIKVVAIPNVRSSGGSKINPNSLVYSWERDFNAILGSSGIGKRSLLYKNSYLNRAEKITVTASTLSGGRNSRGTTDVSVFSPKILFYEKTRRDGVKFEQSLRSGFALTGSETTIVAIPYFFSPHNLADGLSYNWVINNNSIPTPEKKNELTLLKQEGGTARISLSVENISKIFQEAIGTLNINLGQ